MIETAESTIHQLLDKWQQLSKGERLKSFQSLPRDQADDFFLELNSRE